MKPLITRRIGVLLIVDKQDPRAGLEGAVAPYARYRRMDADQRLQLLEDWKAWISAEIAEAEIERVAYLQGDRTPEVR
jgi:hypothetical protein